MTSILLLSLLVSVSVCARACYWNKECPFLLYSTKTPYDTVRGDIRDFDTPLNCKAVSIWTLNRHGNRTPGTKFRDEIIYITSLKDEIVASYEAGRGQFCSQDIENLRRWSWNIDYVTDFQLTETGQEELFGIAKRIREKFPHLFQGAEEDYYLRSFKEDFPLVASAKAFLKGLTKGTNLTLAVDEITTRDNITMPGFICDRYNQEVLYSQIYRDQKAGFFKTAEFVAVQNIVQQRLGITTQLTPVDIYTIYEICRYDRSWSRIYQSPWCAAFSNQDLEVLEYLDDVRHYYRKGYGSWVNAKLGEPALKDLYESFGAAVSGRGRKVTSYFAHLTLLEMVWCAMGIYKDTNPLLASYRNTSRLYRTSKIGAFAQNMIVVLNSCQESGTQTHRVQFFINEKETEICPLEGCTWQQFQDKFQRFTTANLDFCNMK